MRTEELYDRDAGGRPYTYSSEQRGQQEEEIGGRVSVRSLLGALAWWHVVLVTDSVIGTTGSPGDGGTSGGTNNSLRLTNISSRFARGHTDASQSAWLGNLQPTLSGMSNECTVPARVTAPGAGFALHESITLRTNALRGVTARTNAYQQIEMGLYHVRNAEKSRSFEPTIGAQALLSRMGTDRQK